MIAHRPARNTGPSTLAVLPGGSTAAEDTSARAYTLTDLDESHDDALSCSLCAGVIEPGGPMTYRADPASGFAFFHPTCALVREPLAGAS